MLFGKKKEEKKAPACGCSTETAPAENTAACCCSQERETCCGEPVNSVCCVKVLGSGCKSCHELYENTKEAVKNKGLDVEVEYVTDMEKVMAYGAMSMPVLVVNEKVVSVGRVLKASEVEKFL